MSLIKFLRPFGLAITLAAGCAPRAVPLAADHPANPDAEPGRLAGAPSALRAGVAQLEEPAPRPAATPAHDHSTHDHGAAATPAERTDAPKPTPAPADGAHQHGAQTTTPPADKPAPAPKKTAPNQPATPKQPPAEKPAPEKPAPEKPAPTKPAPHPPGHEGHH